MVVLLFYRDGDAVLLLMLVLLTVLPRCCGCCSTDDVLELFCSGMLTKEPRKMMVLLFH